MLRPLVTACSRTPLAWRVRNMRLRCQGWEMGNERPCQATRLLPRKRCGLAISGEADKGRLRGGAAKGLRRHDAQWWWLPGRQGTASPSAHTLIGSTLQSIYLPWAPPHTAQACLSLSPLSPVLPSQGSAQTCFSTHSAARLGPAQCLSLPGFPALLKAARPRPLLLPWAQLLPPKPRGHSQLNTSHWFTQVPPLWQVLLSHTFFLAGQPRMERRALRRGFCGSGWRGFETPHSGVAIPGIATPLCMGLLALPHPRLPYQARCRCWR